MSLSHYEWLLSTCEAQAITIDTLCSIAIELLCYCHIYLSMQGITHVDREYRLGIT